MLPLLLFFFFESSQKRDAQSAGHRSAKTATAVRAVTSATVEARAMVVVYAAVRSEATAAMMTATTTTTTTTMTTTMTAAETSVEAAVMVTADARTMAAAMAEEGGSVGRYVNKACENIPTWISLCFSVGILLRVASRGFGTQIKTRRSYNSYQ